MSEKYLDGYWDDGYTAKAEIREVSTPMDGQVKLRVPLRFSYRPSTHTEFEEYVGRIEDAKTSERVAAVQYEFIGSHLEAWSRKDDINAKSLSRTNPAVIGRMIGIITSRATSDTAPDDIHSIDLLDEEKN